jgi:hypothetical protein
LVFRGFAIGSWRPPAEGWTFISDRQKVKYQLHIPLINQSIFFLFFFMIQSMLCLTF